MNFFLSALFTGIPIWVMFLVLYLLEREPKRLDLPEKLYPEEPISDRIYRRDIVPIAKKSAYALRLYWEIRSRTPND